MATGRGHLRATTAARAGVLAIASAVLSVVLVSPALAQQVTGAAQPGVDAAAPVINAAAAPPAGADPALPSAAGQAQTSVPPLQPQPAAKPAPPEPPAKRVQPTAAAETRQPEPVTRLVKPAVDAAKPNVQAPHPAGTAGVPPPRRTRSIVGALDAAKPPVGGERPLPRTAESVNGAAHPLLRTSQPLLDETQSMVDPVTDTSQSLFGPLGDATQPLLGSLGDAVGARAPEPVSLFRSADVDLAGTGRPQAGALPQAPLSRSTIPDPWISALAGAVLGERAGSPLVGSQQSPVLRPHPGDLPLWHPATSSHATFAAPPGRGESSTPGAEGPAPSTPAGTPAGAGSSGSAPFAPIGLWLLLVLATPSLSRFLRTVPAFLRPTPFICALERPG